MNIDHNILNYQRVGIILVFFYTFILFLSQATNNFLKLEDFGSKQKKPESRTTDTFGE